MYCYHNLLIARERAGLSQAQVGALLGTTQQQYYKYENGIQEIPPHHVITLAKEYGVSIDYLLSVSTKKVKKKDIKTI